MNMFQLQERIKDFSKDQLVKEMQQPSGAVPPFLVLSELQRRTRMEKAFQAEQAQGQQSTVAQDAIAAAGVPQGGIADMAQALAPQTDMTGNTGAMPVQNMYGGGVVRMQPGGLTPSEREGYLIFLDQMNLADSPRSQEMYAAMMARQRENPPSPSLFMPGIDRAPQNLALSDVDTRLSTFMPGAEAPAAPVRQPSGLGPAPNADTLSVAAAATAPSAQSAGQRALEAFTGGVSDFASSVMPDLSGIEALLGRFTGEQGSRPAEDYINPVDEFAGLDGFGPGFVQESAAPERRGYIPPTIGATELNTPAFRNALRGEPNAGLATGLRDAAESADPLDAFGGATELNTPAVRNALRGESTRSGRPGFRPGDTINITGFGNQTLDELRAIIADPNSSPGEREAAQTRLSVAQGVGSVLQGTSDFLAEPVGPEGSPTLDMFADAAALIGRAGNYPIELAGRAASLVAPETGAGILDWTEANKDMYDSWATAFEPDVGAQIEAAARRSAEEAAAVRDAANITESLKTPEEVAAAARAARDAVVPRPVPRPDRRTTPPAGGGGAGARAAGAADADKWLALAQFGLGLMASQQPTLGGAIGEAGTAALSQLRESQKEAYERDLAERTLAARSARGRDGLSASNLISIRSDLIEQYNNLTDGLGGEPTAADLEAANQIKNQLAGVDRLLGLDALGGLGAVSADSSTYRLPSATK